MKSKKGFTLIEILVAIAIVAILAAVVLTTTTSFRAKGRSTKALAQLSSAIPGMVSCWGNITSSSERVIPPTSAGGGDICSLSSNYGKWPAASGDLSSYQYASSSSGSPATLSKSAGWYITLSSQAVDKYRVCCNSAMNSCKLQTYSGSSWNESCSESSPTN